jgi:hypothetical protein
MSIFNNNLLAGAGAQSSGGATYSIDQSIRFNFSDSAYMSRAVGSGGNTKTWTFSCWFKIGVLGSQRSVSPFLWSCHQSDGNRLQLSFDSGSLGVAGDFLSIYDGASASTIFRTNRVFRDPSAWYNLVLVADTSNTVSSERFRVYVNGQRETSFSTFNAPSLNADLGWNQNGSTYYLGDYFAAHGTYGFDGYIAEMVHIDGQALDPSSFGETNDSGIWIPKDVSGLTFGTKGFYIDGRDSADLGDDESGNGNDFTTSGLASDDQMADSPTNNHCTWNPLRPTGSTTMSDGNLTVTTSGATYKSILGTIGIPPNSGIFYYEGVVLSHTIQLMLGWGSSEMGVNQNNNPATPKYFAYADYLGKYYSSSGDGSVGDAFENNDVIGLWIDTDNTSNNLKFYRNGTLQSTHSFDFSDVDFIMPLTQHLNGCSVTGRFASNQWTQTPSGITTSNAINTKNIGS